MILNCKFICNMMCVFFYDGTKESGLEVCNTFNHEFEWMMWKEPWPSKEPKSEQLIYHCHDGEYDNVVPANVYIFRMNFGSGHITHTEWLTQEEFDKYFEIIK